MITIITLKILNFAGILRVLLAKNLFSKKFANHEI